MKAKKSLGQHFLTSRAVAEDIVNASSLKQGEWVLEIGPGQGFLTKELLQRKARVLAIETDPRMIEYLHDVFAQDIEHDNLIVLHKDILDFDPKDMHEYTEGKGYSLIANIPYYITGAILRHFLQSDNQPSAMTLLIQKEVAERIVARDSKESILSISVKAYGQPKIIRRVSRKLFNPPPKVDSSVLLIQNISKNYFSDTDEELFFSMIKKAFSQKRKQLRNTLSISKELLQEIGFNENIRAEDVSLQEWKKLYIHIQ